jgi:hypothetical protein
MEEQAIVGAIIKEHKMLLGVNLDTQPCFERGVAAQDQSGRGAGGGGNLTALKLLTGTESCM